MTKTDVSDAQLFPSFYKRVMSLARSESRNYRNRCQMEITVLTVSFTIVTFIVVTYICLYALAKVYSNPNAKRTTPASTLIVVGSGGHTKEILTLLSVLDKKYSPRCYVVAATDKISQEKIETFEKQREEKHGSCIKYTVHKVARSREVAQTWLSSILTTVYATLTAFPIVFKSLPEVILCNGPGTCIPICFAGLVLKVLTMGGVKIIYVESICRVETLSLSAKILYYLADHLLVQWPSLQTKYPRTQYIGRIV